jgi:hypothetical protein
MEKFLLSLWGFLVFVFVLWYWGLNSLAEFREARRTEHLLDSFSDAFGVVVVIIHQSAVDSPAS